MLLKNLVLSKYHDAKPVPCSDNYICIFSKQGNRRLSGYFKTEEQAWESAAEFNSYVRSKYGKHGKRKAA